LAPAAQIVRRVDGRAPSRARPAGELSFGPQRPRLAAADLPQLRLGKEVFQRPVAGVVFVVLVGTDQAVPQVDERHGRPLAG